jgi:hypothetical protein
MSAQSELISKVICEAVDPLIARHPEIQVGSILQALEHLRFIITEKLISQSSVGSLPANPLDKRAPHGLRHQQKRPS